MWTFTFDRTREQHRMDYSLPCLDNIEFSRSSDGQYKPFHAHEECHLLFCTDGAGFLRLNDVELELTPGTLALIRPGVLHMCGAQDGIFEFWGLSVFPPNGGDVLTNFFLSCPARLADCHDHLDFIRGSFALLHRFCGEDADDHSRLTEVRSIVYSLLCFARVSLTENVLSTPVPSKQLPMDDVLHYIMDHYKEDISLDMLARTFHMSSSHLSRTFFQSFRVSPINYLIDFRLNIAKDLLYRTDAPVYEIARRTGYENVYHFSSLFRRRIGLTPQQFRNFCRSNTPSAVPPADE